MQKIIYALFIGLGLGFASLAFAYDLPKVPTPESKGFVDVVTFAYGTDYIALYYNGSVEYNELNGCGPITGQPCFGFSNTAERYISDETGVFTLVEPLMYFATGWSDPLTFRNSGGISGDNNFGIAPNPPQYLSVTSGDINIEYTGLFDNVLTMISDLILVIFPYAILLFSLYLVLIISKKVLHLFLDSDSSGSIYDDYGNDSLERTSDWDKEKDYYDSLIDETDDLLKDIEYRESSNYSVNQKNAGL